MSCQRRRQKCCRPDSSSRPPPARPQAEAGRPRASGRAGAAASPAGGHVLPGGPKTPLPPHRGRAPHGLAAWAPRRGLGRRHRGTRGREPFRGESATSWRPRGARLGGRGREPFRGATAPPRGGRAVLASCIYFFTWNCRATACDPRIPFVFLRKVLLPAPRLFVPFILGCWRAIGVILHPSFCGHAIFIK